MDQGEPIKDLLAIQQAGELVDASAAIEFGFRSHLLIHRSQ
jgi:hypothetical protein